MKKLSIILLLLSLYSTSVFSQFELTKDGLKVVDSENDYIVYEFKDKTKNELYTSVLKTITLKYRSAKNVLSTVENETISINGLEGGFVGVGKLMGVYLYAYDLNYKLNISFRDEKIKIEIPKIQFSGGDNGRELRIIGGRTTNDAIFNKKGKLKEVEAKERIETFFNELVTEIKQGIEGKKNDW